MENTNLLLLIGKSRDEIDLYLGDVSPEQFVEDVKTSLLNNVNKLIIKEAIEKLQALL